MQSGTDFFVWSSFLPIGTAFCYAASMVSLRSFDKKVSNSILYLYSASAAAAGAIVMALDMMEFSPIASSSDALRILTMSICGGFGVVFLMYAYRNAPASIIAPLGYFGILTSFGFGSLFFADFPIDKLFPGVVLLIASGITLLWRERHQNTEEILTLYGEIKNDIDFLSSQNSSQILESYSSAIGGLGFVSTVGSSSALAKSFILLTAFIREKTA